MRATIIAAVLAVASGGAVADFTGRVVTVGDAANWADKAPRRDPQCQRVPTKNERDATIRARDQGAIQREAHPTDPILQYQRAKETGRIRDGWRAILMVQRGGQGRSADLKLADALWRDYWCSEVLPAYEDRSLMAFKTLKNAAGHGLPSAVIRLSEAYDKGEFGQPIDHRRAAALRSNITRKGAQH